jgi:uncharacterized protein YbcC (UPF0753/DUF2309 family)
MSNLLEQNIFFKMNKTKYNPDINVKNEEIKNEREINIFKKSNTTYNSITNHVPEDIKSQKDLELNKDKPIQNIEDLIMNKAKERLEQEQLLKPIKQKILVNSENETIQNFNDLKNDQVNFTNEQIKIINNNKNKYENILNNLKNLGIL